MEVTAPATQATPTTDAPAKAESKPVEAVEKDGKPETPAAPKEPPRRHKVKVDDEEVEVDEDELRRGYTHARAATKRMEEAAKTRKEAEQFLERFLDDPMAILDNPNVAQRLKKPLRQMMEERLAVELRREIDPDGWQKEQEQQTLQQKAKAYEEWQKSQEEAAKNEQMTKLEQHYAQEYDTKLKGVLDTAGLPRTTNVVRRAAQLMQVAIKNGYEPDLSMIVDQVRQEYQGDTKSLYSHLTGDQLIAQFGEEIANKIRKADLARLRKPAAATSETTKEAVQRAPRPSKEKLNPREFFEAARKRSGL